MLFKINWVCSIVGLLRQLFNCYIVLAVKIGKVNGSMRHGSFTSLNECSSVSFLVADVMNEFVTRFADTHGLHRVTTLTVDHH